MKRNAGQEHDKEALGVFSGMVSRYEALNSIGYLRPVPAADDDPEWLTTGGALMAVSTDGKVDPVADQLALGAREPGVAEYGVAGQGLGLRHAAEPEAPTNRRGQIQQGEVVAPGCDRRRSRIRVRREVPPQTSARWAETASRSARQASARQCQSASGTTSATRWSWLCASSSQNGDPRSASTSGRRRAAPAIAA